jgi:hypothetical protein
MGVSAVLSYIAYRIRMRGLNRATPATSPPYCDHD